MEHLLTARDLADRLSVSTETVLRWIRRGELPANPPSRWRGPPPRE